MDVKFAKLSNHAENFSNPKNSVFEMKGQKGLCCLVEGQNLPKEDNERTVAKITKILVESYMKRPSLTKEAMDAIFELCNNGMMVNQSPQYPAAAYVGAVFFLKDKFVCAVMGDVVIFHFVDGILTNVFTQDDGESRFLGNPRYVGPKVSDVQSFPKGDNTFLICSGKFASSFSEQDIEYSLSRATHTTVKGKKNITEVKCESWLRNLWDNIDNMNDDEEYSAIALNLPAKKKSKKLIIIIIAIAAALLIAFGVLTMTRMRQRPPQPQDGMGGPDGFSQVGPNGETAPAPPQGEPPAPPTRPPMEDGNALNQNAPAAYDYEFTAFDFSGDLTV